MKPETNYLLSAVLENPDLLRYIGQYLTGTQLPLILSFKAARDALKPLNTLSGEVWIRSNKKHVVVSVAMVQWAVSLGCEINLVCLRNNFYIYAASNGSLEVLRWLPFQYSEGLGCCVYSAAAENGHLPVLEFLRSSGVIGAKWNDLVCYFASRGGHLHVLQWLREILPVDSPAPWSGYTFTEPVVRDSLHMFYWLRAQEPPFLSGGVFCYYAAMKGHLDLLKLLRAQEPPCPWDKEWCRSAASSNVDSEVQWWILSQSE